MIPRHFRSLFHRRPTRRRLCCRHGKPGIRAVIQRHRNSGKESRLLGFWKRPVLRARDFPYEALDRAPGKGHQRFPVRRAGPRKGHCSGARKLPKAWAYMGNSGFRHALLGMGRRPASSLQRLHFPKLERFMYLLCRTEEFAVWCENLRGGDRVPLPLV